MVSLRNLQPVSLPPLFKSDNKSVILNKLMRSFQPYRSPSPVLRKYSYSLPVEDSMYAEEKFVMSDLKPWVSALNSSSTIVTISSQDNDSKASMNRCSHVIWESCSAEKSQRISSLTRWASQWQRGLWRELLLTSLMKKLCSQIWMRPEINRFLFRTIKKCCEILSKLLILNTMSQKWS